MGAGIGVAQALAKTAIAAIEDRAIFPLANGWNRP
jgi:hypothetical protein